MGTLPLVVVLTSACLLAQKQPPGTIVEGDLGLRLDNVVLSKAPGYWGSVLVAVEGKILFAKGYGLADRQKAPIGPQSLFDLGGASEQLTLLAALRLVADKKLRLEDAVGKYLADWPSDKAGVTIESLVRHTSGLPPEAKWEGSAANTSRTAIPAIARTALIDRPGQAFHYSSVNTSLLALVLEELTHQRFERVLLERVTKPFGMATAALCNNRPDQRLLTLRRSPANERGDLPTAFDLNWAHRGARGVMASVFDVHALLAGLVAGKLLDAELLAVLWNPVAGGDGYSVTALPGNGETFVRVGGQTIGYRVRWILHRTSRSWIVLMTEDYGSHDALEGALVGELSQLQAPPIAEAPAKPAAAPAAGTDPSTGPAAGTAGDRSAVPPWPAVASDRFVGTFLLPRGGGSLRIERDGPGLRLVAAGLQASARLAEGRWPPPGEDRLRKAEDLGLRLLARVLADEGAVDREGFVDAVAGGSARKLVREWQQKNGAPLRVECIGTRLKGPGESWFRLVGAQAELVLHAPWNDERRWVRCLEAEQLAPFAASLEYVRPDCAVARAHSGSLLSLTIEGQGVARRLVFEDASAGRDGLLDCDLAPSPR